MKMVDGRLDRIEADVSQLKADLVEVKTNTKDLADRVTMIEKKCA